MPEKRTSEEIAKGIKDKYGSAIKALASEPKKKQWIAEKFEREVAGQFSHINSFDNPETFVVLEEYRERTLQFIRSLLEEVFGECGKMHGVYEDEVEEIKNKYL